MTQVEQMLLLKPYASLGRHLLEKDRHSGQRDGFSLNNGSGRLDIQHVVIYSSRNRRTCYSGVRRWSGPRPAAEQRDELADAAVCLWWLWKTGQSPSTAAGLPPGYLLGLGLRAPSDPCGHTDDIRGILGNESIMCFHINVFFFFSCLLSDLQGQLAAVRQVVAPVYRSTLHPLYSSDGICGFLCSYFKPASNTNVSDRGLEVTKVEVTLKLGRRWEWKKKKRSCYGPQFLVMSIMSLQHELKKDLNEQTVKTV